MDINNNSSDGNHHHHHHYSSSSETQQYYFGNQQPPFLTLEETESQPPPPPIALSNNIIPTSPTITSSKDRIHHGGGSSRSKQDDHSGSSTSKRVGGDWENQYFVMVQWFRQRLQQQPPKHSRNKHGTTTTTASTTSSTSSTTITGKHVVSFIMTILLALVICDTLLVSPDHRWIKPESSNDFLRWVQAHPYQGLAALMAVIAIAVVFMIPVGTPLTLGCGYIYKGTYGWGIGVTVATIVSMAGSAIGALICFLLGRYLMRDQVRKWVRKYPLFDAIDAATAEHGLRIMAMLYLTPILPLGPVSYMCGTTSMPLSSFIIAKIASLPLMLLYVFIGASTGALISDNKKGKKGGGGNESNVTQQIEQNQTLIVSGILLSVIMIVGISYFIKKELYKTLERQKKLKPGEKEDDSGAGGDASAAASSSLLADDGGGAVGIDLGATSRKRRHVVAPTSITTTTTTTESSGDGGGES